MRKGSHTVTRRRCHIVWVTKYLYHVLKGYIQYRCRELIIQICDVEEVKILKRVVSKDHMHIHIEYPTGMPFRSWSTDERQDLTVVTKGVFEAE